jgi:hypothetical protein
MAKMPFYSKLQNRRLRDLTTKINHANSWWQFFNSPFGLWLISAILITLGGSYLNARRECIVSARTDMDTFYQLTFEIQARRERILVASERTSNSIDFWNAARSNAFVEFKQFDGQSLASLLVQHNVLRRKIKIQGEDRLGEMLVMTDLYMTESGRPTPLAFLLGGGMSPEHLIDDMTLAEARLHLKQIKDSLPWDVSSYFGSLRPNCSIRTLVATYFSTSEDQPIISVPTDDDDKG